MENIGKVLYNIGKMADKKSNVYLCHHCGFKKLLSKKCENCHETEMVSCGPGVEKISEEIINVRRSNQRSYQRKGKRASWIGVSKNGVATVWVSKDYMSSIPRK